MTRNANAPHPILEAPGVFWRCDHGNTGINGRGQFVGCPDCPPYTEAEHHRDTLVQAIVDAASFAGIIRPDAHVDGPTALMLCEDLGKMAKRAVGMPPAPDGDAAFDAWHDARWPEPTIYAHRVEWRQRKRDRREVWDAALAARTAGTERESES